MELRKNELHGFLRDGRIEDFNRQVDALSGRLDLADCDLSNLDLRTCNLKNADLRNSYLKQADLRGVDLSTALLEGASFNRAKISGVFFPEGIHASEIRLSVEYGTRLRYARRPA